MTNPGSTLFERLGGEATFTRLVEAFYEGIKSDEVLLPMYPQDDLEGAIWRLSFFLQQYFGGPTTYSEERGHPRLRMRHAAFRVNPEAKEHWLTHISTPTPHAHRMHIPTLNLKTYESASVN